MMLHRGVNLLKNINKKKSSVFIIGYWRKISTFHRKRTFFWTFKFLNFNTVDTLHSLMFSKWPMNPRYWRPIPIDVTIVNIMLDWMMWNYKTVRWNIYLAGVWNSGSCMAQLQISVSEIMRAKAGHNVATLSSCMRWRISVISLLLSSSSVAKSCITCHAVSKQLKSIPNQFRSQLCHSSEVERLPISSSHAFSMQTQNRMINCLLTWAGTMCSLPDSFIKFNSFSVNTSAPINRKQTNPSYKKIDDTK